MIGGSRKTQRRDGRLRYESAVVGRDDPSWPDLLRADETNLKKILDLAPLAPGFSPPSLPPHRGEGTLYGAAGAALPNGERLSSPQARPPAHLSLSLCIYIYIYIYTYLYIHTYIYMV